MQEFLNVLGMVIGSYPVNDYDKRITLLTKECGKITAFVKGARRQGSRFLASSDLFCFGNFDLYVGKSAYNVQDIKVSNYFEFLREDINAAYYGMYFLEIIDYYTRENNDEALELLLLYRALQGLKSKNLSNEFVKTVFEIKLFMIEGEFIPLEKIGSFSDKAYSVIMDHILNSGIEELFNFKVDDDTFEEMVKVASYERDKNVDRPLKSYNILSSL